MWKLKVSKFKNTAPNMPKKEEMIGDLSVGNLMNSSGNHIKASCKYMAFNMETSGGGCLGLLPVDFKGRNSKPTLIQAHTDFITDFDFSPFDDGLLATGSQDALKIWHLPNELNENICNANITFPITEKRIENIQWHPTASNILALSLFSKLSIYDIISSTIKYEFSDHQDQIQGISWKANGSLIATTCKDKKLRVFDPRACALAQEGAGHVSVKDSRVLWIGDTDNIISTGFDQSRSRVIHIYDHRNMAAILSKVNVDSNTGTLMPLYDEDTRLLFTAGKGDTFIRLYEASDQHPYLSELSASSVEQIKGVAMVPKLALNVMKCEVARLLVLTKNAVIPVPYQVPRKSHAEFYEELFPDTNCRYPAMTAAEWIDGKNTKLEKISLDPAKKGCITSANEAADHSFQAKDKVATASIEICSSEDSETHPKDEISPAEAHASTENKSTPKKIFASKLHQSKFRHMKGTTLHKSLHKENIKNLSNSVPGESDGFTTNEDRCAVSIAGSGGLLAVFENNKPGRLPSVVPVLQNGRNVTDFVFDPFDNSRLVVACDDGRIQVWTIPDGGITETLTTPDFFLVGHMDKLYFIRFHPLAKNIIATASYDMTVRIWNLKSRNEAIVLQGHTDTIFNLSWSPDGRRCATVSKDGKIRIYEPRLSTQPITGGSGPAGSRGARVLWACDGKYLVVSGFDQRSMRVVIIYDVNDLSSQLSSIQLDTSPSILIPYYDEDSSTLFLTGRGDSSVLAYEVYDEYPHLFPLSPFKPNSQHQAISFLPKTLCNVRNVEFAKAFRLTNSSIEPVSFTVPRVKVDYFQDDIFCDTSVTTNPTMTADEWLNGANKQAKKISLCPLNMRLLSDAPPDVPEPNKFQSFKENEFKTDDQKKAELISAMVAKMEVSDEPLPQDLTQGVDSDEWSD